MPRDASAHSQDHAAYLSQSAGSAEGRCQAARREVEGEPKQLHVPERTDTSAFAT